MITALVVLSAVLVGLVVTLAALAGVFWSPRRGGYRGGPAPEAPPSTVDRLTRERFVVTLKSGASFSGVLVEDDGRVWLLRETQALGAGDNGTPLPVDGELLLFVADIAYAQRP